MCSHSSENFTCAGTVCIHFVYHLTPWQSPLPDTEEIFHRYVSFFITEWVKKEEVVYSENTMDSKTKYVENRTFSGNTSSIGTRDVLLWKVKCLLGSGQVKNSCSCCAKGFSLSWGRQRALKLGQHGEFCIWDAYCGNIVKGREYGLQWTF